MKNINPILDNVKKYLKPNIAKANLNAIDSTPWFNKDNITYQNNINKNILTNDVLQYLYQLEDYYVLEFLIGFHSLNFQFWTPSKPQGFEPYINNGLSGFYACLDSYFGLFKHLPKARKNISLTQLDFFNFFGDIPKSKERFNFILEVWNSESLDNVLQIIKDDSKDNLISIDSAYKISKLLPNSFDDPYLRKAIYLLWDYINIINKKNNSSIKHDLPMIADHQTAKILSMYNLITYNTGTKNKIKKGILIEPNSMEELAIRSSIVFVSDQICKRKNISSSELYNLMWQMRAFKPEPFFLCESTKY